MVCGTRTFAPDCPGKHAICTLASEDVLFAYENKLDRRSIDKENFLLWIQMVPIVQRQNAEPPLSFTSKCEQTCGLSDRPLSLPNHRFLQSALVILDFEIRSYELL